MYRHVDCTYPEVKVATTDGPLEAGMLVLLPCPDCGDTPLDALDHAVAQAAEAEAALLAANPRQPLYHWTPARHRKQIIRHGLVPGRRAVTHATPGWRAPYTCFADSPSWAWALSGDQPSAPAGEWDLWQTTLDLLPDVHVLPSTDRASGIHEVRTTARVFKRHLWWVASREVTR